MNTGDLGRINPGTGHLIITGELVLLQPCHEGRSRDTARCASSRLAGRAKDTIVLSNGENIEPQPIEDAVCTQSDLVCSIRDSRVVMV